MTLTDPTYALTLTETPEERAPSALATLSAVPITGPQLERAQALVALLPPYARDGGFARRAALNQFAADEGIGPAAFASAALLARLVALEAFVAADKDAAEPSPPDLAAAAVVARLVATADGPRFDAQAFAELVAFLAEMPF